MRWGPLEIGDIRDRARLDAVFAAHRPVAVLHFAALIEVAESVRDPGRFFDNNVSGAITLLQTARAAGVEHLVFSSTCATYGAPTRLPLTEDHAQNPLNPYGRTKLMVEQALWDYAAASSFRAVALRYFNAAGAAPAEGARPYFSIYGDDYDTRDGTALRDYVHVLDLADAHVLALARLIGGGEAAAFNLGTGTGTTVRELVSGIERASGRTLPVRIMERRAGDAAALVADNSLARKQLAWRPSRNLDHILADAWLWHSQI